MRYCFALVGNQNCGKTTLFNALTGSNQHVGNFPGITVEKKEGIIKKNKTLSVVDLPGVYSLTPYTAEEIITRDYLLRSKPNAIINIVDATNLERNLYLTAQLLELGIPMVLALNMMDEVRANSFRIDIQGLSKALGIAVVPISANRGEGIDELVFEMKNATENGTTQSFFSLYNGDALNAIKLVAGVIAPAARQAALPVIFCAARLIEGDEQTALLLNINIQDADKIKQIGEKLEKKLCADREAIICDMRYELIDRVCKRFTKKTTSSKAQKRSIKLDTVLTHKVFALPIFFLIMLLVFWLTFGVIGTVLSSAMKTGIEFFTNVVSVLMLRFDVAPLLHSLVIDGVFAGVGSVLSFLPTILVLFFMLSVLEDTGYMARVAFVMDRLMRKIGLSGRSFVPLLIGFGCSVPAIMATRTLPSERDRKMTALLVPFMSCSAKLPIYVMLVELFFKQYKAFVFVSLYFAGIIAGVFYALFFKNTIFKSEPVPFVLELPAYRFPSIKNIWQTIERRAKDFLTKAFTVIFLATIVIWFLQRFNFSFDIVMNSEESMLAKIGLAVAPVLAPLGFSDWRISTALITGLTAKEAVISTLNVLVSSTGVKLTTILSPLSAYAFLIFTLLYMPCIAAVAAIKRELSSTFGAILAMVSQTTIAWLVAFCIYNIGSFFC